MKLLDRYIARQYLFNIVLLHVILFAFVIAIDYSLNFDEFTDIARRMSERGGEEPGFFRTLVLSFMLVLNLWWPRLFLLFNYIVGLVMVGALGFTCTQMVRHREFVAVLAGGLSLHRIARPFIGVAILMLLLVVANRELVIPKIAPLLVRDKTDAGMRTLGSTRQDLTADAAGRLYYIRSFNLDEGRIEGLWVWERDESGLMTRRITADAAQWAGDRWTLVNGQAEERLAAGATRPRIEPIETLRTDLDPTALRLRRFEGYSNHLGWSQIGELVDRYEAEPKPPVDRIESLERTRWGRISVLVCNLLAVLVCMPFFLKREPTNMVLQALFCAPVALLAFVGSIVGSSAQIPGLAPQIAVFLPVLILLPLAIAAVSAVRT